MPANAAGASNQQDNEQFNLCFHIRSVTGRTLRDFYPEGTIVDLATRSTILFRSGTEFMVCKREQKGEVLHVYIREICLGFGKNVVLWCDDGVLTNSLYNRLHDWVGRRQFKDRECMATQYVYKTQSLLMQAYF